MIARFSSGNFVAGAMQYNKNKVDEGGATVLAYKNFDQCLKGYIPVIGTEIPGQTYNNIDTQDLIHLVPENAAFMMQMQIKKNTRIEKGVFSCSLNLNQVDLNGIETVVMENGCKDENDLYRKIADKYMEGMGYGKQPYVVFKHEDIDRPHIHIVSIKVDADGKKIDEKNSKKRSEEVRQQINQSFGLSTLGEGVKRENAQTIIDQRLEYMQKMKNQVFGERQPNAIETGTNNLKKNIGNVLRFVDEHYHPKNLVEYNKVLAQFNVVCKPCTKGQDNQGKGYSGCQFAVMNDKGEVDSHLIKGSAFGKGFSYQALEQKFALNSGSEDLRKSDEISKTYIRNIVDSYLKAPSKATFDSFVSHLDEKGIKVNKVADSDDLSKIKGINFVDNLNGHTFSGSQLGKAYTYNRICDSIDKHNLEIDRVSVRNQDSEYLSKDDFLNSQKVLKAAFNGIYESERMSFPLESSFIKRFNVGDEKPTCYLIDKAKSLVQEKNGNLNLTDEQWHKAADFFIKDKVKHLPEQEFKEDAMYTKRVVEAVQFAQHIPDAQSKSNFLFQSGVNVQSIYGKTLFSSAKDPKVMLSYEDICSHTKDSVLPVTKDNPIFKHGIIPEPYMEFPELSVKERRLVSDLVAGKNIQNVDDSHAYLLKILDAKIADPLKDKVFIPFETKRDVSNALFNLQKDIVNGKYNHSTLSLIDNFDRHKFDFNEAAYSVCNNSLVADILVDDFKKRLEESRPAILEKEKSSALSLIAPAVQFAFNIKDRDKQSEFLTRMGVKVEYGEMGLQFSTHKNPNLNFYYSDLSKFNDNLPVVNVLSVHATNPEHTKQLQDGSLRRFSLDAISQVQLYNDHKLNGDTYNFKASAPLRYLSENLIPLKQLDTYARMHDVIDRNPDASVGAVVKALNCRGFIIKPVDSIGSSFKIGMHDSDEKDFIPMPKDLSDRLIRTNYMAIKDSIDSLLHNRNYLNGKTWLLMDITRAADYNSPERLDKAIDKVRTQNSILANAMVQAKGNGATPDYERVASLVYSYRGEKTIILPPPTPLEDSFAKPVPSEQRDKDVKASTYQSIQEVLRNGTFMDYIFQKANERLKAKEQQLGSSVKAVEQPQKAEIFKGNSMEGKPDFNGLCNKYNINLTDADKANLNKFGKMDHTVHTVIDGERDLVVVYDKQNNQFALAKPESFVFDRTKVRGVGLPDDTYSELMKNGCAVFKDCPSKDGTGKQDTFFFLNPVEMKIYSSSKIIDFVPQQKAIQWPLSFDAKTTDNPDFDNLKKQFNIELTPADRKNLVEHGAMPHLVSATIEGTKMDVVINYEKDDKKFYIASPSAFKLEERHFDKLGEQGVDTLLKSGVADVKDFNYNGKIIDTKVNLNAKDLLVYVFENNPKFYTDDDLKESKTMYNDYSQDVSNNASKSRGMSHN